MSLGEALLTPTVIYVKPLLAAIKETGAVKALAHITGGGLPENLPRVLPDDVDAEIRLGSWPVPPLFQLVEELTPTMSTEERYRTLNMGIGMVIVVDAADAAQVQASIAEPTWIIGELRSGSGRAVLR